MRQKVFARKMPWRRIEHDIGQGKCAVCIAKHTRRDRPPDSPPIAKFHRHMADVMPRAALFPAKVFIIFGPPAPGLDSAPNKLALLRKMMRHVQTELSAAAPLARPTAPPARPTHPRRSTPGAADAAPPGCVTPR